MRLGIPLQELKEKTTSSEFIQWIYYLNDLEPNEFHREDWYMAQIAAEIRRGNAKHPRRVKMKDSLLSFRQRNPKLRSGLAASKSFWLGSVGVKKE